MTALEIEKEIGEMAEQIADKSAVISFRDWLSDHRVCQHCGLDFKQMGAQYNLYPHFVGCCQRRQREAWGCR